MARLCSECGKPAEEGSALCAECMAFTQKTQEDVTELTKEENDKDQNEIVNEEVVDTTETVSSQGTDLSKAAKQYGNQEYSPDKSNEEVHMNGIQDTVHVAEEEKKSSDSGAYQQKSKKQLKEEAKMAKIQRKQMEEAEKPKGKYAVFPTSGFFGCMILFDIPVIGWIACFFMSFIPKNLNLKHYARARLIKMLIKLLIAVLVVALLIWVGGMIADALGGSIDQIKQYIEEFMDQIESTLDGINDSVDSMGDLADSAGDIGDLIDSSQNSGGMPGEMDEIIDEIMDSSKTEIEFSSDKIPNDVTNSIIIGK